MVDFVSFLLVAVPVLMVIGGVWFTAKLFGWLFRLMVRGVVKVAMQETAGGR